jgi:3-oxoadipate enol-lactonase
VINHFSYQDLVTCYYDNQHQDKPALVFIHGLGENLSSWNHQLNYFAKDYRVIAMDLRGHGQTNDGIRPISIKQYAVDVLTLLDQLKVFRANFVGLSMGGMIIQELTKHHQDRMLSIALCNTAAYPADRGKISITDRLNFIQNLSLEGMAEYVARKCLARNTSQAIYEQALDIFRQNRLMPYLAATTAAFTIDFRQDLSSIYVPTLIIVGEFDVVTPIASAQFLHQHITNSKLAIIPDAGHLTKLEQPTQFNQVLKNFLLKVQDK